MNTEESNKLIAEFMGFTYEKNLGYYDNEMLMGQHVYDQQQGNCFDDLLFNTSWDWLMPVVEKIGHELTSIDISFLRMKDETYTTMTKIEELNLCITNENPIDAVYTTVLNFIKWYNENKEN